MYLALNQRSQKQIILASITTAIAVTTGCGPGYYMEKIRRGGSDRGWFVYKLGDYPRDERVTAFLIDLLDEENAGVRYFAAESLDRHRQYWGKENAVRALYGLIGTLDDPRIAMVSWPVFGPFLPGGSGFTGSVRARALLTLTLETGKDFGFDQEAWNAYMRKRFPAYVDSREDKTPNTVGE